MIYDYIGALAATWIIYNILKILLMKFMDKKNLAYISFIGSSILILIITNFTMGAMTGFTLYLPCLFVWLVLDLVKFNKSKDKKKEKTPA